MADVLLKDGEDEKLVAQGEVLQHEFTPDGLEGGAEAEEEARAIDGALDDRRKVQVQVGGGANGSR